MEENLICFYTTTPFWTGVRPDITSIKNNNKVLSEKSVEFENDNLFLSFCKDGLIMTKIKRLESRREEFKETQSFPFGADIQFISDYLKYLNSIQILLSSALLKVEKTKFFKNAIITSDDIILITFKEGQGISSGLMPLYSSRPFLKERYTIPIGNSIPYRQSVHENVIKECFEDMNLIIDNFDVIQLLNDVNGALSEYQNLNFRQALVQSWFIIEYFLNKKWIDFLQSKQAEREDGKYRIDKTRREYLTGRDITSAVISNILELNDIISYEIFEKIGNARSKRNTAVHNLDLIEKLIDNMKTKPGKKKDKRISSDDCRSAFQVITYFFKSEYQLDLRISGVFSYSSM